MNSRFSNSRKKYKTALSLWKLYLYLWIYIVEFGSLAECGLGTVCDEFYFTLVVMTV